VSPDATETHIGKRLYAAGWRQGAILRSSPFKGAYNNKLVAGDSVEMKLRRVKGNEFLVIISQDCDILAKSEPFVEAFVCSEESSDFCAKLVEGNSSRWFLIDQGNRLVAHATRRVTIKKELLEPFEPERWPSDDVHHLDRFARWLARRYTRPALSEEFNETVQDPIREALENVPESIAAHFSKIVHEIRIGKHSTQGPPFDVTVTLLIVNDEATTEEADAIEHITQEIQQQYESDSRIVSSDFPVRTPDEMPVSEYFATYPLYLEYYTYEGEEFVGGAESLPQT
jgi:hypothetical protein